MKYLIQFLIIASFFFTGEILNAAIPLPVPAAVWGMLLLFAALCTGLIRLEWVADTGDFLKDILPVMFVGPSVGMLELLSVLAGSWVRIVVICIITTFTTILITGHTAQGLLRLQDRKRARSAKNAAK